MKLRSTLVLLLVVVSTGTAIWMLERETVGTRELEEMSRRAISVNPGEIDFFALTTTNESWVCRKQGIHWRFTEPITGFADTGEMNRILTGLKNLPKREVITVGQREERDLHLHDYGLELPVATIRLSGEGGPERTFLIGGPSPLGDSVYVMEQQFQSVVATGTEILDLLPASMEAIRSRTLMPNSPYVLRRIEIKRPGGFVLLVNEDDRGWFLQQPVVSRADQSFVQDLITKLTTAEVSAFSEDRVSDFVPFGLDQPEAKISLWPLGGGTVRSISLGQPSPSNPDLVYARTDDGNSVVEVSNQLLVDVSLDANAFRDRKLMDVSSDRVASIRVTAGEQTIEMAHDDAGSWSLVRPRNRAAESAMVWDALDAWTGTRIEQFVSDAATNLTDWGLGKPVREVVLSARRPEEDSSGPSQTEGVNRMTLRFYTDPETSDSLYVMPAGSESLYKIPAKDFLSFPLDPLLLYDRSVLQLVPSDIRRIQITRNGNAQSVELDGEGNWKAGPGLEGEPIESTLQEIIADVSNLRATRYEAEDAEDLSIYGIANPLTSITLGLTGDAGISKTVLFGRDAQPDGVYAMIRGQSTVFVLPQRVRDRLLSGLLDQSPGKVEGPIGISTEKETLP